MKRGEVMGRVSILTSCGASSPNGSELFLGPIKRFTFWSSRGMVKGRYNDIKEAVGDGAWAEDRQMLMNIKMCKFIPKESMSRYSIIFITCTLRPFFFIVTFMFKNARLVKSIQNKNHIRYILS